MSDPTVKGAGWLQIYVHDDKDQLVSLAANIKEPGGDTTYYGSTGRFYLKINSANCKWKVSVEDQR
jgi:hypothetical protein